MTLPLDILQNSLNSQISILLKDGRKLEGKLLGYDEYMNMVLEDTNETTEENSRKLGMIVLRGNNIIRISPKYKSK
jgi:small nuclear ribonucleoprotein